MFMFIYSIVQKTYNSDLTMITSYIFKQYSFCGSTYLQLLLVHNFLDIFQGIESQIKCYKTNINGIQ